MYFEGIKNTQPLKYLYVHTHSKLFLLLLIFTRKNIFIYKIYLHLVHFTQNVLYCLNEERNAYLLFDMQFLFSTILFRLENFNKAESEFPIQSSTYTSIVVI